MNSDYSDIASRIAEKPTWYDTYGAPRYGKFTPENCPDIYTNDVVLMHIKCQDCGMDFAVEQHRSLFSPWNPMKLHYGDPPRHNCVGDTMNCEDIEIIECWHRPRLEDWVRRPECEGTMTEAWNYEDPNEMSTEED